MKSNLNELFNEAFDDLKASSDIDIEGELDKLMPMIRFDGKVTKAQMAREIIRGRFTSLLNSNGIYSFSKGHFVNIENANEDQLRYFMEKAKGDIIAASKRKHRAEMLINQISFAWDENGNFIGYHIPKAVNE